LQADDFDSDRIPNYIDLDSDQDGVPDISENFGQLADQDNDGVIDNFVSTSGNGLDDNYAANLAPLRDTDSDGQPNSLDLDSDNDGLSDLVESGGVDANNDGVVDGMADTDGDGIADINDVNNTGGIDSDADGIDDASDIDFVLGLDTDSDGVVDFADPDSDGNGFVGPSDNDALPGQGRPVSLPDLNNDGVPDLSQFDGGSRGVIETGLGGTGFGCSVSSGAFASPVTRFDPTTGLLLITSIAVLGWRTRGRTVLKRN